MTEVHHKVHAHLLHHSALHDHHDAKHHKALSWPMLSLAIATMMVMIVQFALPVIVTKYADGEDQSQANTGLSNAVSMQSLEQARKDFDIKSGMASPRQQYESRVKDRSDSRIKEQGRNKDGTNPIDAALKLEQISNSHLAQLNGRQESPLILGSKQASDTVRSANLIQNTTSSAQYAQDTSSTPTIHIVFSTSCNEQQHWESMVFFYHAHKVNQPGTVTRILSGCKDDKETQEAVDFFTSYIQPMAPTRFFLHVTPDFSRIALDQGKYSFKYMNKPYGFRHWMEVSLGLGDESTRLFNDTESTTQYTTRRRVSDDNVVILMDPDMILLRPITHDYRDVDNHIIVQSKKSVSELVVRHGHPIAQQDGYLSSEWRTLNISYITGLPEGQYVPMPPNQDCHVHWNAGPPYLMTVKDGYRIACKWTEYAPRVLDVFSHIFAEMYGYIIATVQLNLPHTLIKSLVVSEPISR
jgi:hypothetical protein